MAAIEMVNLLAQIGGGGWHSRRSPLCKLVHVLAERPQT